jgi:DNA invertase Pin-like site-specific DNA recombinase
MTKQSNYNVGIYVRLSQEDERAGESLSIENQKKMLTEYVGNQAGWNLVEICEDDGYSGTTFDRPGVQKLIGDAMSGKIDLILVKDLSRFGRNYIEVGQYIDYIFPSSNIRFIALSDNVDTLDRNSTAMDLMPIMNLFNEWHAANTSKKIRAVMVSNAKQGKYHAPIAAYGYLVSDTDDRRPIIDENTAPNVRRIFKMRSEGVSSPQIAKALNADNIQTPSDYTYQRLGKPNPYISTHLWSAGMVRDILHNPVYIGAVVNQKYTTVSYKNHKKYIKDSDEWIVVENAFEPIIDKELWDKVQEVNKSCSRSKTTKSGEILPLGGLMYCADCGSKLKKNTTTHTTKKRGKYQLVSYMCNNYANHGKTACTSHHILQRVIEGLVLADIRARAGRIIEDEDGEKKRYMEIKASQRKQQSNDESRLLKQAESRLAELDTIISKTYEERMLGKLPDDLSAKMLEKYSAEQKELSKQTEQWRKSKQQAQQDKEDVEKFIQRLKKWSNVDCLTRELAMDLIEFVVVYARPEKYGAPRKVDIYYKFISKPLADSRNLLLPQNCVEINQS